MATDTGIFRTYYNSCDVETFAGQQVSIFSIDSDTEITLTGLKYPLSNAKLTNWWVATLNEALGNKISLNFKSGRIIVFLKYLT
jgi:thiamine pyrophosphokinase